MRRGRSPKPGTSAWAYLCRAGSERDVLDELAQSSPARLSEGLVLAKGRPAGAPPAFARQAMRTSGRPVEASLDRTADALARMISAHPGGPRPWTLQVTSPDSRSAKDRRRAKARLLDSGIAAALDARLSRGWTAAYVQTAGEAEVLAQVWMIDEERVLVGVTKIADAISREPGLLTSASGHLRGSAKLDETFAWLGFEPERGETTVVLETKTSAWADRLLARGQRVLAVGSDRKDGRPHKRMLSIRHNPFEYFPEDTVDWMMCDLARRPIETTKLLAKWGRKVWASHFLLNLKLPMKEKAKFVREAVEALEAAGWSGVRARQLHPDRDEVTIYGFLDPKLVARGWQPPYGFERKQREAAAATADGPRPRAKGRSGPAKKRSPIRNLHKSPKKAQAGTKKSPASGPTKKPPRGRG